MSDSLKKQSVNGVIWSGMEKFITFFVTFVVNIIMARLLSPPDYGIVAIITVFISFSQLFIDGGFTTALIAKNNRDETDFQTVFVFNLLAAVILYGALFLSAPWIETFYKINGLCPIIRTYSLMLIISSFSAIQITKLTIAVDFKTISKVTVPSGILAGCLGIVMAYSGCGVWSIVGQHLLMSVLRVVLSLYYSRWMPHFQFSYARFKELFRFSSNLIVSSLIDRIYTNSYPMFIGKFFPPATLGYYTRGDQFGRLPAGIFDDLFNRVTFPLLSQLQDDKDGLANLYRKYIKLSSFGIFPIMMLMVVLAEPIIRLLLTDKWLGCVPFMQILSMAIMMNHIGTINRNLLYVKHRSDWALKLEIMKKVIAIAIFVISTYWGIMGVCFGQLIYGMMAPSLNALYTYRLIGLNLKKQLADYLGIWFLSLLAALVPLYLVSILNGIIIQIVVGFLCYISIYLFLHFLFRTDSSFIVWAESVNLFKRFYKKKSNDEES